MKVKRFDITVDCLQKFFNGKRIDFEVERNPIPDDAQLIKVSVNDRFVGQSVISLFYISEQFPDVEEGMVLESTKISIRQYFKE